MPVPSSVAPDAASVQPGDRSVANCYHCGALNVPRARWTAVVDGAPRAFCCAGCQAVAEVLHAAGLDALYARRERLAGAPATDVDDEWTGWGQGAEASGLVRTRDDGRREAALLLEGLTCGACVPLIESWLARQPGVTDVQVNYATRRAVVGWDALVVDLAAVLRAVAAIGYRAYAYDPARREALARRERRALLTRMAVAMLAMMQVMMFALPGYLAEGGVAPEHQRLLDWASFVLALPAMFYSAAPLFAGAWRDLAHRRLGMDVPIALGLAAAFTASTWSTLYGQGPVYFDSVTMFIALILLARYVELAFRQRAAAAIEAAARQRPDTAEHLADWPADTTQTVAAATLELDDVVLVRPGALVPADGTVIEGRSHVEEALLTGESAPLARGPGSAVFAGAVNREAALILRVEAAGEDTRLAAILRLTERASGTRPKVAQLADRAAAIFVGALLALAAVTALVWWQVDAERMLAVTFSVLVVSCPCALALATPAALAAAAGALARQGVVLARGDALETLAGVTHVVLDKTGTLTEGRVRLVACKPVQGCGRGAALALAAALEAHSEHPLARAVRTAANQTPEIRVDARQQLSGRGIEAQVDGSAVRIGRLDFVGELAGPLPAELALEVRESEAAATLAGLGNGSGWIAILVFADALRSGAEPLVAALRASGIVPVLLSGDRPESVAAVAASLGIADARAALLPEGKRDAIALLQAGGAVVAMVGDGINDAPALAQAQVSVSLGGATPLAQWIADVVVLPDRVELVAATIAGARRAFAVIRQNLVWAALYNAIAIPAAAFGYVTPLAAAIGMSASSLLVVGNALRLLRPSVPINSPRPMGDDIRAGIA